MDKYYRVPRIYDNDTEPNEVRIGGVHSQVSASIEYGLNLLNNESNKQQQQQKPGTDGVNGDIKQNVQHDSIVVKAIGSKMISKAIFTAEIIKLRVPGLHQITEIGTTDIKTQYMPKEEGLDKVEILKKSAFIKITLSKIPLDTSNPGYQAPLLESEIQKKPTKPREHGAVNFSYRGGGGNRGRGGFRGGFRGNTTSTNENNTTTTTTTTAESDGQPQQITPTDNGNNRGGRGRGRGRGGRGRGRGRGYRSFNNGDNNNNTTTTTTTTDSTTSPTTTTASTTNNNEFKPVFNTSYRGSSNNRGRGRGGYRGNSNPNSPTNTNSSPTTTTTTTTQSTLSNSN